MATDNSVFKTKPVFKRQFFREVMIIMGILAIIPLIRLIQITDGSRPNPTVTADVLQIASLDMDQIYTKDITDTLGGFLQGYETVLHVQKSLALIDPKTAPKSDLVCAKAPGFLHAYSYADRISYGDNATYDLRVQKINLEEPKNAKIKRFCESLFA